jgi:hypothetical protein
MVCLASGQLAKVALRILTWQERPCALHIVVKADDNVLGDGGAGVGDDCLHDQHMRALCVRLVGIEESPRRAENGHLQGRRDQLLWSQ